MEDEVFISVPMMVAAVLGVIIGLFISLAWLKDWVVKRLNKNKPVTVIDYRDGKLYKRSFATIKQAAAFTIKRRAKGQDVAYIEVNGKTIWHSKRDIQSLVRWAKK